MITIGLACESCGRTCDVPTPDSQIRYPYIETRAKIPDGWGLPGQTFDAVRLTAVKCPRCLNEWRNSQ